VLTGESLFTEVSKCEFRFPDEGSSENGDVHCIYFTMENETVTTTESSANKKL